MTDRPQSPRLEPLTDAKLTDEQRELLAGVALPDAEAMNIFATLARHPSLFRKWLPFGGKLLAGKLPARDRELLILRTATRCRTDYEWGHHVSIGKAAGLTDDEIQRVPGGTGFSSDDELLLRAADELHDDACLSDATWAALAGRYDEAQLIELVMVVGHYHLVAFTLNSLGVQPEPGVARLPTT